MPALTRPRTWLLTALLLAPALPAAAAPSPAARPDLSKLLIDDTDFVLVVNVKQILASPAFTKNYQKQAEALLQSDAVKPWLEGSGFDPLKDVERLVVVMGRSCHPLEDGNDEAGPLLYLQGRFDPDKLRAKADKMAESMPALLKAHAVGDTRAFELRGAAGAIGFVTLLDRSTAVFAPRKDQVADAAARFAGKKKVELKYKALKPLLDKMSPEDSVSFVALGEMVTGTSVSVHNDGMKTTRTVTHRTLGEQGIASLQGAVRVGDQAKGTATITAKDDAAAKKLAKQMTEGLGMAKAEIQRAAERQPQLVPIVAALQSVRLTGKGRTIALEGQADAEAAGNLPLLIFGVSSARPTAPPAAAKP